MIENKNIYVGNRYVPKIIGEWNKLISYEGLSIVTFEGTSYTSKKATPVGVEIFNDEYWVVTGNYNAQVEVYRQEVKQNSEDLTTYKEEVTAQFAQTVEHIGLATQYGFVADYQGVPNYDGLDVNRVTATDNTDAFTRMLDDAIEKKNLTVRFGKGHYGIKTGNITRDLTGVTLTVIGDDLENTIIDFIKESDVFREYVNPTQANVIANLNNPEQIIFKDICIKATTNYNNIGGDQKNGDSVYWGSVWGFNINHPNKVKFERVKVSHFNYRGLNVNSPGHTSIDGLIELVEIVDCVGFHNKGSGFWVNDTKLLHVKGGEFSYNGQFGQVGTGYGVTASAWVEKCIVDGGSYHHNYRKGFDTHGGLSVELNNVRFNSNAWTHWYVDSISGNYSTSDRVIINNITMEQSDINFLRNHYLELIKTEQTHKGLQFFVRDSNQRIKEVIFNNVNMLSAYNGYDVLPWENNENQMKIDTPVARLEFNNSNMDSRNWDRSLGTISMRDASPYRFVFETLKIINTHFFHTGNMQHATTGGKTSLFDIDTYKNKFIVLSNATIFLNNGYIFGMVSDSTVDVALPEQDATGSLFINNVTVKWSQAPTDVYSYRYFGNPALSVRNNLALFNGNTVLPSS